MQTIITLKSLQIFAVPNLPDIKKGDSIAKITQKALQGIHAELMAGDILVIAQKIISKSEGRLLKLSTLALSEEAQRLSQQSGKNALKVQAILNESESVLRVTNNPPNGTIICRHKLGWVCANSGIDESNLGNDINDNSVLLLPKDPDASARKLRQALEKRYPCPIGVIISDTFGRAWRKGQINVAIGLAGVPPIRSLVGKTDAYGKKLVVSEPALADEVAAVAGLLMDKADHTPIVIVRGLAWVPSEKACARDIIRPIQEELFT